MQLLSNEEYLQTWRKQKYMRLCTQQLYTQKDPFHDTELLEWRRRDSSSKVMKDEYSKES